VRESENRTYRDSIETDAEYEAIEAIDARPREFASLARLLDPLLFRSTTPPPVPDYLERYLDRHVYQCVNLRRYFFPRLAHLADAFGRAGEGLERVLAIGVGTGYQEAFLAGRIPGLDLLATDVERQIVDFPMPNLRFETLDLLAEPGPERYDFVFSIECLEHVEDYRRAFRNHAARVAPGKFLYISVPFASREEQRDEELRRIAWEEFEHYTPGFAFEDLDELFAENGFEVVHASNMFFTDVMLPVRAIVEAIDAGTLEAGAEAIARLELLAVRDRRVESCREAEGIRFLGRKKG
jgi:trans-aconitate methyltransferase